MSFLTAKRKGANGKPRSLKGRLAEDSLGHLSAWRLEQAAGVSATPAPTPTSKHCAPCGFVGVGLLFGLALAFRGCIFCRFGLLCSLDFLSRGLCRLFLLLLVLVCMTLVTELLIWPRLIDGCINYLTLWGITDGCMDGNLLLDRDRSSDPHRSLNHRSNN